MTLKLYQTAIKMIPQSRKKHRDGLGALTTQHIPKSLFLGQGCLAKASAWVVGFDTSSNKNMKLGEGGRRVTVLGGALAVALAAGAPEQAEAQDFDSYCAPLANGEVLEVPLDPADNLEVPTTPDGPPYEPVFDAGQVTPAGFDALSTYFADGIGEACNTEIETMIEQAGGQVLFVVSPPNYRPFGIDPETLQEIQANYRACIGEAIEFADENENGVIDGSRESRYLQEEREFCDEDARDTLAHEQRMAELAQRRADADQRIADADQRIADADQRIAASRARQEAFIRDWFEDIVRGDD